MKCFFDTSALVKLFQEEIGSDIVEKLAIDQNNELWISELAKLEFLSAVFRRFRQKEISEEELKSVIDDFEEQLQSFHIDALGTGVLRESERLMKKYGKAEGLRSLDALHLASCCLLAEHDWFFVCSDTTLFNIAEQCVPNVINPIGRFNP